LGPDCWGFDGDWCPGRAPYVHRDRPFVHLVAPWRVSSPSLSNVRGYGLAGGARVLGISRTQQERTGACVVRAGAYAGRERATGGIRNGAVSIPSSKICDGFFLAFP
jgi:hypothetical protein